MVGATQAIAKEAVLDLAPQAWPPENPCEEYPPVHSSAMWCGMCGERREEEGEKGRYDVVRGGWRIRTRRRCR